MLLRISCFILGHDYKIVKTQTPKSKQKIMSLALLLMIPVLLWGITGYLLSNKLMGASVLQSALIAGVMSSVIYAVDRSIVNSSCGKGTRGLRYFRVIFACLSAFLGSVALDMVIFNGDIEEYRVQRSAEIKKDAIESYQSEQAERLKWFQEKLKYAERKEHEAKEEYDCEVNGTCGTGIPGLAEGAATKKEAWLKAREERDNAEAALLDFMATMETNAVEHGEQVSYKAGNTILSRFQDFHEYVSSNIYAAGGYFLFLVILLFLELFMLIYKASSGATAYDHIQHELESIKMREIEDLRDKRVRLSVARTKISDRYRRSLSASTKSSLRKIA